MWAADLNLRSTDLDHCCRLSSFLIEGDDEQRIRQGGLLSGSH